jgi:2'-5' RNA ligase
MLITDTDDRSRQGSLWRAEQRQTTGSIPPANSVFFALYPDPHAARRLDGLAWYLRHKHRLNGRPLADRRLHVSLCNIGDYARLTSEAAAAIDEAMAMITMAPFLVAFDEAKSFRSGNKQPVVLVGDDGVAGLMLFQRELVAALDKTGIGPRKRRLYNPHVTLLGSPISPSRRSVGLCASLFLCAACTVRAGIFRSRGGRCAAELFEPV